MFFYEQVNRMKDQQYIVGECDNFTFPPHLHQWYELIIGIKGEITVKIDSRMYILHKDDTLLVFPNQLHEFVASGDTRHRLCLFDGELIPFYDTKVKGRVPENNMLHVDCSEWITLFRELKRGECIEKVKGILYLYCAMFGTENLCQQRDSGLSGKSGLLRRILDFANENFTSSCSLKDLSENIFHDYSYLSKLFSDSVGMTFTEYINMLRIDRACRLLRNTSDPIIDICTRCGYNSPRSFSRNFRRFTGTTPREYRENPNLEGLMPNPFLNDRSMSKT